MSTASGEKGWVGQNYDKLALMLALMVLLGSALTLVLRIGHVRSELAAARWETPSDVRNAEAIDIQQFDPFLVELKDPYQAEVPERALMVSELRVASVNAQNIAYPIPYEAEVCPFTGYKQPTVREFDSDGDGLADLYEKQHGLDPKDPLDAALDLDGDDSSNIEEFLSGTDPSDPKSYPSPPAKLRLLRVVAKPFILKFEGVAELATGRKYQLNMRTREGRTFFVAMGEEVQGYKVAKFDENIRQGPYGPIDRSVLTLTRGGKSIPLEKNKEFTEAELSAKLIWLADGREFTVRKDDPFELKAGKYKVIDIQRNRVVIRDLASEQLIPIRKMSESERAAQFSPPEEQGGFLDPGPERAPRRSAPLRRSGTSRPAGVRGQGGVDAELPLLGFPAPRAAPRRY